jgi:hypothetical protein
MNLIDLENDYLIVVNARPPVALASMSQEIAHLILLTVAIAAVINIPDRFVDLTGFGIVLSRGNSSFQEYPVLMVGQEI